MFAVWGLAVFALGFAAGYHGARVLGGRSLFGRRRPAPWRYRRAEAMRNAYVDAELLNLKKAEDE